MAMTGVTELIRLIGSFRPERHQQLNILVIKDKKQVQFKKYILYESASAYRIPLSL